MSDDCRCCFRYSRLFFDNIRSVAGVSIYEANLKLFLVLSMRPYPLQSSQLYVVWTSEYSVIVASLEFFLKKGSNRLWDGRWHSDGDSDVEGAIWGVQGLKESYIKEGWQMNYARPHI